jgi:uncharacterized coiled-coil DUF342 family protein
MSRPIDIGGCCQCGEPMWMTQSTYETYKRNNQIFHCVHGHQQHWPKGKTEAQKLREQLDAERIARQRAEQRVAERADEAKAAWRTATAYKGQATRLRNRAKAGVCPCCNRTFKQLAARMASQHPQFTPTEEELTHAQQ